MQEQTYLRLVKVLAGCGLTTVLAIKTVPQLYPSLLFIEAGRQTQTNENISDIYDNVLHEVCKDMKIDKRKVDLVIAKQLNSCSAGSLYFPGKPIIGLPQGSFITDVKQVNSSNFAFNSKIVDPNSYTGKQLIDSLFLTEQQVKFIIAHELTHIKEHHFMGSLINSVIMFSIFFPAGLWAPTLFKMQRPLALKALINSFVWFSGYTIFKFTDRYIAHFLEFRADKFAAQLGKDYCDGGILMLRKQMKVNRIVRLMNHKEDIISDVGNNLQDYMNPKLSLRLKELKTIKLLYY